MFYDFGHAVAATQDVETFGQVADIEYGSVGGGLLHEFDSSSAVKYGFLWSGADAVESYDVAGRIGHKLHVVGVDVADACGYLLEGDDLDVVECIDDVIDTHGVVVEIEAVVFVDDEGLVSVDLHAHLCDGTPAAEY